MLLINKLTPALRSSNVVNHWYDYIYRPNWTQLSPITITNTPIFYNHFKKTMTVIYTLSMPFIHRV